MQKYKKYRVKNSCLLLDDVTRELDPIKFANCLMLVFSGIVIGIMICYLIV